MRQFFKLTIPKGSRKKRAHKKWMKAHGIQDYLNEASTQISEDAEKINLSEIISTHLASVATFGHSHIDMNEFNKELSKRIVDVIGVEGVLPQVRTA